MYNVSSIRNEAAAFVGAVRLAEPFRPLMVKLKLTWECNLRCAMCGYWRQSAPAHLTTDLVERTLDELAALGCRKVHFSGGEPTLRADLPDLIAHARRIKLRVALTTNGTLITRELARRLVRAGLNGVCVSIDSPVRSVHDQLRGAEGAFKETLAGVRALHRAAERQGKWLAIQINTVVSRESYDTLDKLPALAHELGAQRLLLMPVDDPSGQLLLNKRRLSDYNQRIAPALAEKAVSLGLLPNARAAYVFGVTPAELAASRNGQYARGLYARQPCYAPWTHALVAADAQVMPCCKAMHVTLGDLQYQSFSQVWQGEVFGRLRQAMRARSSLPECATCAMFLDENQILHHIFLNRQGAKSAKDL